MREVDRPQMDGCMLRQMLNFGGQAGSYFHSRSIYSKNALLWGAGTHATRPTPSRTAAMPEGSKLKGLGKAGTGSLAGRTDVVAGDCAKMPTVRCRRFATFVMH